MLADHHRDSWERGEGEGEGCVHFRQNSNERKFCSLTSSHSLSFKLQPLSKCIQIEIQIQYSYCSFLKIQIFFNESKGEAEYMFTSHGAVETPGMLLSAEAAPEEQ